MLATVVVIFFEKVADLIKEKGIIESHLIDVLDSDVGPDDFVKIEAYLLIELNLVACHFALLLLGLRQLFKVGTEREKNNTLVLHL